MEKCKNCGKEFIKKSYQHKFCSNKGKGNCKDKFHNRIAGKYIHNSKSHYDDSDYEYASMLNELGWDGHKSSF